MKILLTLLIAISVAFGAMPKNPGHPSDECKVLWKEKNEYAKAIKENRGQKDYNTKELHKRIDKLLEKDCNCVIHRSHVIHSEK